MSCRPRPPITTLLSPTPHPGRSEAKQVNKHRRVAARRVTTPWRTGVKNYTAAHREDTSVSSCYRTQNQEAGTMVGTRWVLLGFRGICRRNCTLKLNWRRADVIMLCSTTVGVPACLQGLAPGSAPPSSGPFSLMNR